MPRKMDLFSFLVSVVLVRGHLEPRARGCYGTKIESHGRAKLITSWQLGSKERHQVNHLGFEGIA